VLNRCLARFSCVALAISFQSFTDEAHRRCNAPLRDKPAEGGLPIREKASRAPNLKTGAQQGQCLLAEGIQDEILTRLSKIADLKSPPDIHSALQNHLKTSPRSPGQLGSATSWKEACKKAAMPCA